MESGGDGRLRTPDPFYCTAIVVGSPDTGDGVAFRPSGAVDSRGTPNAANPVTARTKRDALVDGGRAVPRVQTVWRRFVLPLTLEPNLFGQESTRLEPAACAAGLVAFAALVTFGHIALCCRGPRQARHARQQSNTDQQMAFRNR